MIVTTWKTPLSLVIDFILMCNPLIGVILSIKSTDVPLSLSCISSSGGYVVSTSHVSNQFLYSNIKEDVDP